jgi:hypothetical protein
MVDFNAASGSSGTSGKLSSQEYLEQLRLRRQQRYQNDTNSPVQQQPAPDTTQQPIAVPVYTPPVIEPTYAQAVQPIPVEPATPPEPPQSAPPEPIQPMQEQPSQPAETPIQPAPPKPVANTVREEDEATSDDYYDQPELYTGPMKPMKEEVILEWSSPSRPFKKRNRQFFSTIGIIALLISLILFFAGQVLIIAVVISVVFLGYVLATVPPDTIKHRITTYGINSDGILYYWEELGRFWFDTKLGQQLVSIETDRFPIRIVLLLGDQPEELIRDILSEVLLEERPIPSTLEKMANWLEEKIPLETS